MTFAFEECDDDVRSVLSFLNKEEEIEPEKIEPVTITINEQELNLDKVNKSSPENWVF